MNRIMKWKENPQPMGTSKKNYDNIDASLTKVREMVQDIRYGNVVLIVQDGKIIQIDKTEKVRL